MRLPRPVLALLLATLAAPAAASELVGALSQNRVSLTASFSGSEILIFGAIRHDAAPPESRESAEDQPPPEALEEAVEEAADAADADAPPPAAPENAAGPTGLPRSDVIIVIEGPRQALSVWRKERRAGIWMNVNSVAMTSVPSFYAVASTAPLHQILSPEADAAYDISVRQAIRADQAPGESALFTEALMRIRERSDHYVSLERWVHLDRDILFRANVRLPANLTEGAYTTRMYLVQEGQVVSQYRTAIFVRKDGFERWLHQLAYEQPFLYGLLALAIALVAGWGASALFQKLRQS